MESGLSAELRREPFLGVWREPEFCLSRPSAGSLKVDAVWEGVPSVRTGFLGCGKRSFLLARMECKEADQSRRSALSTSTFTRTLRSWVGRAARSALPILRSQVSACVAASGLRRVLGSPAQQPRHRSPLLALRLLEPPGEVFDAYVLELKQVFQTLHLHLQDLGGKRGDIKPGSLTSFTAVPIQSSSSP